MGLIWFNPIYPIYYTVGSTCWVYGRYIQSWMGLWTNFPFTLHLSIVLWKGLHLPISQKFARMFPNVFHIWVCRHIRVFSNVLRHDDKSNPNRQFLLFCIFSTDNPHISFHFSWSNPNFRLVQYHCWLHPQVDCVDNSDKPHVFYLEYQVSFLLVNLLLIWILVPWQIWIWSSIVLPSGNLT